MSTLRPSLNMVNPKGVGPLRAIVQKEPIPFSRQQPKEVAEAAQSSLNFPSYDARFIRQFR